jgi:CheY-like chemotaxis protein
MLLKREDLRGRLIRLIGQGRISSTTRAMDDAGTRVNRYLSMQLLLNVLYGAMIGLGLYFIGVPNAPLWGACGTVLRFIPYIGPWIAASFPIALSLAVAPGWMMPVLTVALFVGVELLSNNVLEPWLYGSRTGVAPVALIFAAVFWTWLWGPAGLVLATPMTVCLVVMGRHIPRLAFLGVVLSDKDALTPAEDCYYRLLTVGEQDEMELIEGYLKDHSCAALFDQVLIPVISAVEVDHRQELLDEGQRGLVLQGMRDVVEDLVVGTTGTAAKEGKASEAGSVPGTGCRVYCLPARADRDELASEMLSHLLRRAGCVVEGAPAGLGAVELVRRVEAAAVDLVFISVMFPSTVLHARQLCLKLQALVPRPRLVVGLWGIAENGTDAARRVRESGADEVVSTFAEGLTYVSKNGDAMATEPAPRTTG